MKQFVKEASCVNYAVLQPGDQIEVFEGERAGRHGVAVDMLMPEVFFLACITRSYLQFFCLDCVRILLASMMSVQERWQLRFKQIPMS